MAKNNYIGYHIVSKILRLAGFIWFGEKVIGKENIPTSGKCILAGNHLSNYDAYLLFSSITLFFAVFNKNMHKIKYAEGKSFCIRHMFVLYKKLSVLDKKILLKKASLSIII